MSSVRTDTGFLGSIPAIYESHMVPLIFEPYAIDLAARVHLRAPASVLEIAAGTGVVTRALANALPAGVEVIATDLNPAMLQEAARRGTSRPVRWQTADAMQLPLTDASVDAVVCQFGVMFLPDKAKGYAETRRVLKSGGVFLFNVWDRIEDNEIADVVTQALAIVFPHDPPRFMARTPHGYHDLDAVRRDLVAGGFSATPRVESIDHRSRAASARDAAVAYCHGTPLRNEIEARDAAKLAEATDACTAALAARFGSGALDTKIRAHVVMVER